MIKKAVKITILFVVAIISVAILFQISRNNPSAVLTSLTKRNALSANKQFIFTIKLFGVLPVGEAGLNDRSPDTLGGKDVYRISAEMHPAAFVDNFYKITARIESFIDSKSLLPVFFKQTLRRPDKPSEDKEVSYDQEKHTMFIKGKEERVILPDTYDPLSAMSFLRRQDFSALTDFDININTNQKNYGMKGKVDGKEKVVISGKEYYVWKLTANIARRDKNNPYHKSKVTFYLLDDKRKTPILIKVFASGAYIVAVLNRTQ